MSAIQIFVEGKADKKFIEDYISHLGGELNNRIITVNAIGGKDKLKTMLPIFETNSPHALNVLVLDADDDCEKRKTEVQHTLKDLDFEVPFFLIPNNQDIGNLETLLENCINTDHQALFECWDKYIECVSSKKTSYSTPNTKAKIFAYLEAIMSKNDSEKIHIERRDYLNKEHWDLESQYLEPLKKFIISLT